MTTSLVDAESVLAVDLGSQSTRASLFDVVDGQYSFIASGSSPTTLEAPYKDVGESVSQAILQLQSITGRQLLSKEGKVILPSQVN
jgi:ribulose kinase